MNAAAQSTSEKMAELNAEFHAHRTQMGNGKTFCIHRSSAANYLHDMEDLVDQLESKDLRDGWSEVIAEHIKLFK